MTSVAVVSSVYGGYDQPAAPAAQDTPVDYVLVSDVHHDCHPWKTIVEPRPQVHPRLAAKVAKCRPDLYSDADVLIWMDASARITSPDWVSWVVDRLGGGALAQHPHPWWGTLTEEANVAAGMGKYSGLPIREQAAHYLSEGHEDGWGLWASGVIAYRREGWPLRQFGDAWLAEQLRWTYEDQISEAPVLARLGVRPVDLPGGIFGNARFDIRPHAVGD